MVCPKNARKLVNFYSVNLVRLLVNFGKTKRSRRHSLSFKLIVSVKYRLSKRSNENLFAGKLCCRVSIAESLLCSCLEAIWSLWPSSSSPRLQNIIN